ncbi:MAG: M23 family metallopeptidase [Spirulinaceae cyanobacterium]
MNSRVMGRSLIMSGLGVLSLTAIAVATPVPWQRPTEPFFVAQVQSRLIWPTTGAISQNFHRYHEGIDIAGPEGTAIFAAQAGRVIQAGWDDWGLGNALTLEHPDGSRTVYGHNATLYVQAETWVEQGQVIAEMGSTGNSTGPHLHFEYYTPQNRVENPIQHLPTLIVGEIPVLTPVNDAPVNPPVSNGGGALETNCAGRILFDRQTRNFRVQVCEVQGQIYYSGQAKDRPQDSIWLPAQVYGSGYQAFNGNYRYQVEGDRLIVFNGNQVIRSESFL